MPPTTASGATAASPRRVRSVALVALLAAVLAVLSGLVSGAGAAGALTPTPSALQLPAGHHYTFSDSFTGRAGQAPSAQWAYQTGGNGWGNQELETYTTSTRNARLDGKGHLAIVVHRQTTTGTDGITRDWTSARLYSRASVGYGVIEARIKMPSGQGLWPAFWTLGSNITSVGWPRCGEIDVLESINAATTAYGTIHGPTTYGASYGLGGYTTPRTGLSGWHTYAVRWSATAVTWYLDGQVFHQVTRSSLSATQTWALYHRQQILLNVAVGGVWAGAPDASTPSTATMLVDWVHAWSA